VGVGQPVPSGTRGVGGQVVAAQCCGKTARG
jgi:hypothetical protein